MKGRGRSVQVWNKWGRCCWNLRRADSPCVRRADEACWARQERSPAVTFLMSLPTRTSQAVWVSLENHQMAVCTNQQKDYMFLIPLHSCKLKNSLVDGQEKNKSYGGTSETIQHLSGILFRFHLKLCYLRARQTSLLTVICHVLVQNFHSINGTTVQQKLKLFNDLRWSRKF